MRSSSPRRAPATLTVLLVILALPVLSGCGPVTGDVQEGVTIPPASAGPVTDLGPGVRPLSFGPGDKSSPRVSPSGERVAFVLDGYVVDKPLYAQDFRPITTSDFGAEYAEWLPDEALAISSPEVGTAGEEGTPTPSSLLGVRLDEGSQDGSLSVQRLAKNVVAASSAPGGGGIAAVVAAIPESGSAGGAAGGRLVLLQGSEKPIKVYLRDIEGPVTGLSISPDGSRAFLTRRRDTGGAKSRFDILNYRLSDGQMRRAARLPRGMEILGAPQWTQEGIYFVGGEGDGAAEGGENPTYTLYRVPEGSKAPEPVRGVGEDFVAASISVSPDGGRLAVVGRRNPGSPTNLYVLDLASDTLKAATTNESMEIKTNPRDLAWYPDGSAVVLVARGASSGPEVYDAPAKALSAAFYSLYEVRVE
jgi:hypothetical protein